MNPKAVDLFLKLIRIDSPSGEEEKVRDFLMDELIQMGFVCKVDKTGNLFAKVKDSTPKILLCAHMDTVCPGKNIRPVIANGVIKSDGTTILGADNKAGIFAIIEAVKEYRLNNDKLPPIEILFSVKEETGGGVEFFPFSWIEAKRGLTFDHAAPLGTLTLAAPYIYNFRISFLGKSAHASRPEDGVNAIDAAVSFLSDVKVGSFDNHETTINIGRIVGGNGINIIPDKVLVEGEVRSTSKTKFDRHVKRILEFAKKAEKQQGVKVDYTLDGYCPGYEYSISDEYVVEICNIMKMNGFDVKYERSTGVSDVNSLNGGGIKAVCLSDGVKNPHTNEENIELDDLLKLKNLVYGIISAM